MPEAELSLLFLRPLNKLGVRYIVGGSIASMLYGEPRFTNDVDVVVFLRNEDIPRLMEAFPSPEFYLPPAEIIAAEIARPQNGLFNALHVATGFKADMYTTGRDEFNGWAFRNARKMEFNGEMIVVAPPSASLSASWSFTARAAGKTFARHPFDLAVSGDQIDRKELDEWIRARGLAKEWKVVEG